MARSSTGRGAVAALGFFLFFAGLVGGGVLYVVSQQRPGQAVEGFARAPVGCTTTLEFSETGEFFVFEEVGAAGTVEGCQPIATPGADFEVTFTGDLVPARIAPSDDVSYDVDGFDGRSVLQVEIDEPGQYTVEVVGGDLTVLAAIGRDPDEGVADLQRNAIALAVAGVVLGLVMLVVSGRRSKRAAEAVMPEGPGWDRSAKPTDDWSVEAPHNRVPVNPQQPDAPARAEVPSAPLSALAADTGGAAAPVPEPAWEPPAAGATADLPAPEPAAEQVLETEQEAEPGGDVASAASVGAGGNDVDDDADHDAADGEDAGDVGDAEQTDAEQTDAEQADDEHVESEPAGDGNEVSAGEDLPTLPDTPGRASGT